MTKRQIILRAVLDAMGVVLYVVALAGLFRSFEFWLGQEPDTWLAPVVILLLFIISACVTGSLVLLKPVLLYMEGQKREAVFLFAYTVVALVILAFLIIFALFVI